MFLMDMSRAGTMNGVTRYLGILAGWLAKRQDYHVTWIRFTWDRQALGTKRIPCDGYTQIRIPLPQDIGRFLGSPRCMQNYSRVVFHLLEEDFEKGGNRILHLHTLNLIDFALYVRQRIPCKIVTHLHCIPWKGLYDTNRERFNRLYRTFYLGQGEVQMADFISKRYELRSYLLSDAIICVTSCAKDFLLRFFPSLSSRIQVIYNGMEDRWEEGCERKREAGMPVRCLFVGNMNGSKGLHAAMEALDAVRKSCPVVLTVAGKYPQKERKKWQENYPELPLEFTGLLPFDRLKLCYMESDIGIIASLQEQCSYVALEMMMFGLPVVTTDADGLDELFVQNVNALKVPVRYDAAAGLVVDTGRLAHAVLKLAREKGLRARLGDNARQTFMARFTEERMAEETHGLYLSLSGQG